MNSKLNDTIFVCYYNKLQPCVDQKYRRGEISYCLSPCTFCKHNTTDKIETLVEEAVNEIKTIEVEDMLLSIVSSLIATDIMDSKIKEILDSNTEDIDNNQFVIVTNDNKRFKITVDKY